MLIEKFIIQRNSSDLKISKRIINGKLYDTSKAKKICSLTLKRNQIASFDNPDVLLHEEDVTIYKGKTEWFIEYRNFITTVSESWVMGILARYNAGKYIELFGEVEEA